MSDTTRTADWPRQLPPAVGRLLDALARRRKARSAADELERALRHRKQTL